jgi:hypothetical protein
MGTAVFGDFSPAALYTVASASAVHPNPNDPPFGPVLPQVLSTCGEVGNCQFL